VDATWLTPADMDTPKVVSASPDGKFPVLQCGSKKLMGSTDAMLEYIEKTFQEPTLIPSAIRTGVVKWVAFIRDEFTPTVELLLYDGSPLVRKKMAPNLESAFAKLNSGKWEHGKQGRFFFGNQFTLVDVYLIPTLLLVDVAKFFRGIEIGTVHSHLLNYSRAMHSFPNYAPVMVDLDLLKGAVAKILDERAPPPLLVMSVLQHRSILWHLENLVVLADALPVNKIDVDISGSGRRGAGKQMQRLWKMYGRLVDLMQEHAQMEERVIFPAIDSTEEGIMSQKKFFFFFFFFFLVLSSPPSF
jgi:glutathione S-transferase